MNNVVDINSARMVSPAAATVLGFSKVGLNMLRPFKSKADLYEHCRTLIEEAPMGRTFDAPTSLFFMALFQHHPRFQAKISETGLAPPWGLTKRPNAKGDLEVIVFDKQNNVEAFSIGKSVEGYFTVHPEQLQRKQSTAKVMPLEGEDALTPELLARLNSKGIVPIDQVACDQERLCWYVVVSKALRKTKMEKPYLILQVMGHGMDTHKLFVWDAWHPNVVQRGAPYVGTVKHNEHGLSTALSKTKKLT